MMYSRMPMVVSVCQECDQTVRDALIDAYMAGQGSVILEARMANAYWAKQLEELMHRET
jgi:hypothetical protein